MVMNELPSKMDRIRMHWICLRRDCHHAWFHIKGIGREFCQRQHRTRHLGSPAPNAPDRRVPNPGVACLGGRS